MPASSSIASTLQQPLYEVKTALHDLYGDRLVRVILFGSQARGEAHPGSDVDVLVILRGPVEPITEARRTSQIMLDASLRHGLALSLVTVSEATWERPDHPLMMNARTERIEL